MIIIRMVMWFPKFEKKKGAETIVTEVIFSQIRSEI